jgi:hypothetical protein
MMTDQRTKLMSTTACPGLSPQERAEVETVMDAMAAALDREGMSAAAEGRTGSATKAQPDGRVLRHRMTPIAEGRLH